MGEGLRQRVIDRFGQIIWGWLGGHGRDRRGRLVLISCSVSARQQGGGNLLKSSLLLQTEMEQIED